MKRSDRRASCEGKKRYSTFVRAESAAQRIMAREKGEHMHAYHCRPCNSFHVGTRAKQQRPEVSTDD